MDKNEKKLYSILRKVHAVIVSCEKQKNICRDNPDMVGIFDQILDDVKPVETKIIATIRNCFPR